MMNIKIIAPGKIKDMYIQTGIDEYLKRLTSFIMIEIIEIKEITNKTIKQNLLEEEKLILKQIKNGDYIISLAIEGKNLDSIDFAKLIEKESNFYKTITFIIGSSNGLSEKIKDISNLKLSFGALTYPHQLMRLILIEQIYRSHTIINNQKYHK